MFSNGFRIIPALAAAILALSTTASAQNYRILSTAADGQEIYIPLSSEDMGRDIVILAESTTPSAQTVTVTLGGPAGTNGQVLSALPLTSTNIFGLDLNAGWNVVQLGYPNGPVNRNNIIVGESTTGGGGTECPSWISPVMLQTLHQVYPGLTDAQICAMMSQNPSGGTPEPTPGPGELTPARGFVLQDACSSVTKTAVQFRISLAGQPLSVFTSGQAVRASIKIEKTKVLNSGTMKRAEGRDGPSAWIYLAPAIKYTFDQRYGAPGSDNLIVQKYRNGVAIKTKKFKTRPLFGTVMYDISPVQSMLSGSGKLTFTTVNGAQAYSRCVPAKKQRWFFGKYKKLHGIR
jgi:hypothetical protein